MEYLSDPFRVEVSAHHCHLTQAVLDQLFGEGFDLDSCFRRELSQHGQYVSTVRVDIEVEGRDGVRRTLKGVSILGPARKYNQVEISLTDAVGLRIDAPVRQSGKVEGSVPCTIIGTGPEGRVSRVDIPCGVVAQKRHIHINPEQAERMGVSDGQIVAVEVSSPRDRNVIFRDVVVRVDPTFDLSMHLDTDEGNACGLSGTSVGRLVRL